MMKKVLKSLNVKRFLTQRSILKRSILESKGKYICFAKLEKIYEIDPLIHFLTHSLIIIIVLKHYRFINDKAFPNKKGFVVIF